MQTITTLAQAEQHLRQAGIVHSETVEGSQLLRVCGFDRSSANQAKVLKRQIEKHNLTKGMDFTPSLEQSSGGRPKTVYHFTINAANHILLAAMTKEGKQARQEAIDMKTTADKLLPAEKIARSNAACLELANQFGFSGNQALLSASKATEALTGYSPIKLLGVELKSDRKEKTYTVTELGREFYDGMSPQKLNRRFEAAKLQNRVAGQWELTRKGKEHAEILDTGKKRSTGTPVKQIKWFKTVVEKI